MSAQLNDILYSERSGIAGSLTVGNILDAAQSYEYISKNLKSLPYVFNYTGDELTSIDYTTTNGIITKTFNYTGDELTSIVLSGDVPNNITLTKTLSYTNSVLTNITYS